MRTTLLRLTTTTIVLLAIGLTEIAAQDAVQIPDPDFNTRIERPAYSGKRPRVMFDEGHFNVHTTATGYKALAQMLRNDGYDVVVHRGKFTRSTLRGFQILIIVNALGAANPDDPNAARAAFTSEECDVVSDWVRSGGGLLLITDHEPAGSAAEALATRFEIGTSKNFAIDRSNYFTRSNWAGNLVFSRSNSLLKSHSITNGRDASEKIEQVLTFGGQSITGSSGSTPFLMLSNDAKTLVAYPARQVEVSAAGRSQAIAAKHGKGRLVVTGEAGMLSAQILKEGQNSYPVGMSVPGFDNRQLALNIVHWLSKLLN